MPDSSIGIVCGVTAAPLQRHRVGSSHRHGSRVGGGDGRNSDLRIDVENSRCAATTRERLDTNTSDHVVIVLVRSQDILLEDDLLSGVTREGISRSAGASLASRQRSVAGETCLDDGEPFVSFSPWVRASTPSCMASGTQGLSFLQHPGL